MVGPEAGGIWCWPLFLLAGKEYLDSSGGQVEVVRVPTPGVVVRIPQAVCVKCSEHYLVCTPGAGSICSHSEWHGHQALSEFPH